MGHIKECFISLSRQIVCLFHRIVDLFTCWWVAICLLYLGVRRMGMGMARWRVDTTVTDETDLLIVGAGPAGASLACFLGHYAKRNYYDQGIRVFWLDGAG